MPVRTAVMPDVANTTVCALCDRHVSLRMASVRPESSFQSFLSDLGQWTVRSKPLNGRDCDSLGAPLSAHTVLNCPNNAVALTLLRKLCHDLWFRQQVMCQIVTNDHRSVAGLGDVVCSYLSETAGASVSCVTVPILHAACEALLRSFREHLDGRAIEEVSIGPAVLGYGSEGYSIRVYRNKTLSTLAIQQTVATLIVSGTDIILHKALYLMLSKHVSVSDSGSLVCGSSTFFFESLVGWIQALMALRMHKFVEGVKSAIMGSPSARTYGVSLNHVDLAASEIIVQGSASDMTNISLMPYNILDVDLAKSSAQFDCVLIGQQSLFVILARVQQLKSRESVMRAAGNEFLTINMIVGGAKSAPSADVECWRIKHVSRDVTLPLECNFMEDGRDAIIATFAAAGVEITTLNEFVCEERIGGTILPTLARHSIAASSLYALIDHSRYDVIPYPVLMFFKQAFFAFETTARDAKGGTGDSFNLADADVAHMLENMAGVIDRTDIAVCQFAKKATIAMLTDASAAYTLEQYMVEREPYVRKTWVAVNNSSPIVHDASVWCANHGVPDIAFLKHCGHYVFISPTIVSCLLTTRHT